MTGHFITRCVRCRAVVTQCKCPGPGKEERVGLCARCERLGPIATPERDPAVEAIDVEADALARQLRAEWPPTQHGSLLFTRRAVEAGRELGKIGRASIEADSFARGKDEGRLVQLPMLTWTKELAARGRQLIERAKRGNHFGMRAQPNAHEILGAALAELDRVNEARRADLKRYGCHTPECRAGTYRDESRCTCGLVGAVRGD